MLNSSIAKVLADLGHTDTIVIGDCGLPVPAGVPKIDLALKPGMPSFVDVVTEVAKNMVIEKVEIASEMEGRNPEVYAAMQALFPEQEWIKDGRLILLIINGIFHSRLTRIYNDAMIIN